MKRFLFVLMFVLAAASVHAQTLDIDEFTGDDGIRGLVRSSDTLHVKVTAQIPGVIDIEPHHVKLEIGGNVFPFSTCTLVDTSNRVFNCSLDRPVSRATQGSRAQVKLYRATNLNSPVRTRSETLTVDSQPPSITSLAVEPRSSQDGEIRIIVRAREDPSENCQGSGVNLLEIVAAGTDVTPVVTQKTNGRGPCDFQRTITHTITDQGTNDVCVIARDVFNQPSAQRCTEISVDGVAPTIVGSSLLVGEEDEPISFVSDRGTRTALSLDIRGDVVNGLHDIDTSSIEADFSTLTRQGDTRVRPNEIIERQDGVRAIWRNVNIRAVDPCEFTVRAEDTSIDVNGDGNEVSERVSCSIGLDTTQPSLESLVTDQGDDNGVHIFGSRGTFELVFDDHESGVRIDDITVDLGSVGAATRDLCEPAGNLISCRFRYQLSSSTLENETFEVEVTGSDRAGNPLATQRIDAVADNTAPVIGDTSDEEFFDTNGDPTLALINGHQFRFTVNVQDVVRAEANLSAIGGGVVQGTCDADSCTFEGTVSSSGSFTRDIELRFFDFAGNVQIVDHEITSLGIDNDPNPDFWNGVSMECSPSLIDRATAAIGPQKQIFCRMTVHSAGSVNEGRLQIASIGIGDVTECTPDPTGFVENVQLLNRQPGTTQPIAQITLQAVPFRIDELNFSCPLKIITKVGNQLTSNIEEENISFEFGFYNNDIATASSLIDDEVDRAIKRAQLAEDFLENGKKVLGAAEGLCSLHSTLFNALAVIDTVLATVISIKNAIFSVSGTCFLQSTSQALCGVGGSLQDTVAPGGGLEGLHEVLKVGCDIINCKYGVWDLASVISSDLAGSEGAAEVFQDIDYVASARFFDDIPLATGTDLTGGARAELDPTEVSPASFNIRDSLPLSMANLCLPGIIHNWEKWRQIQCRYAVCIGSDVKEDGIPRSVCRDEKHYQQCTYVYKTVVFNSLPFVPLVNYFKNTVAEAISNPLSVVTVLSGVACHSYCGDVRDLSGGGTDGASQASCVADTAFELCQIPKLAAVVGEVIGDFQGIQNFQDQFLGVGNGACDQMKELEAERDEKRDERDGGLR